MQGVIPQNAHDYIFSVINDITSIKRDSLLSLGALLALFFSSNGMLTLMSGFDKAYHETFKPRNWLQSRLIAIALTLVLSLLLIISLILMILESSVKDYLREVYKISESYLLAFGVFNWFFAIFMVYTEPSHPEEHAEPVAESPATPPPLPFSFAASKAVPIISSTRKSTVASNPAPPPLRDETPKQAPAFKLPALNLEQFMGVKLFAWLGGLALFFGIAFFVKYSFEHNLIPPAARIAIGYIVGAGVMAGGVMLHRHEKYKVLAQTLCASGTLILYGVTYAGHSIYHLFGREGQGALIAFGLMTLITATAFLLAIRLNALVVAILGMLGGFLTPIFCRTGQDNPLGLFGYIALLDIGLLMVARVRKWFFLASLGAGCTILMQLAWFGKFFHSGHYFEGAATWTPITICTSFMVLFLIAAFRTKQDESGDRHPGAAAMALCGSALFFAFIFLEYSLITDRTWLLYGFVFFINAGVLAGIIIQPKLGLAQLVVGVATFVHLAIWTTERLKPEMLGSALAVYFIFGVLHSVFPVVWQRLKPNNALALQGAFSPWFPPLTLVLMLLPVLSLPTVSFMVWPAILLVDILAIMVAVTTAVLAPVIVALVLTLGVALAWLLKVPAEITSLTPFLIILGAFAAFFVIAGSWLTRRYPADLKSDGKKTSVNDQVAASLPVMSAALPFALLIMATLRLPVLDPSPVFALGLALVLLLLGLAKIARITPLSFTALACMLALEGSWHSERFQPEQPWTALFWYLGVYAIFALYPFFFRNAFRQTVLPWATAAASAIGHFILVYVTVKSSFPDMADKLGLIPGLFAIPSIISLLAVLRGVISEGDARNGQLAWFGGTALLFITLIFPIQFDRQWLTLSWAMEGAALIWLFLRVPHQGLRVTGIALLGIAFARLAVNPMVLEYHERSAVPVLNWYLYSYGISAVAMFLGAWWLKEPHHKLGNINARGVLWAFGGVLLFWLLNIEIADCFTPTGSRFTLIEFTDNNLARDMTYSIAWGLFALTLLIVGFWVSARGARYAGIGLMALTLLKVFFHDLASLESIYRIAALIGVAILALAASFLYQRFFDRTETK